MALKKSTVALISTAVVASFGIGLLLYYDNKRRNDPEFKKQLKREKKRAAKEEKLRKKKELSSAESLIKSVLGAIEKEEFPESAEAKEAYFTEKVALGEAYVKEGREDDAVLPFYQALKIYPAPLELIMLYQKTIPENVFRIVVNLMALEQQRRQTEFYEQFPPKDIQLKLTPSEASEGEKASHALVADKDFSQGEVLYVESPLVSALHPSLEGTYCNYCMKKLSEDSKIECPNCDKVAFCSKECETEASEEYHTFLCSNNKLTPNGQSVDFVSFTETTHLKYPQMIAQFLSGMVREEVEKTKLGKDAPRVSAWDHIERFPQQELVPTEETLKEAKMIRSILASKVPGVDEFLSDEIYLLLKGKLNQNSFAVPAAEGEHTVEKKSVEPVRTLKSSNTNNNGLGASLYKISTHIGKAPSEEESNVTVEFKDNSNVLKVTAAKDIKKGDEIKTLYA